MLIDLRSDTVTRPCADMRRVMAEAQVGDDVLGDDPTVRRLQEHTADLLGKDAALYVPSGTMANQIAIRVQTQPGDEIIIHRDSHIYLNEAGAPAALSGCSLSLLPGDRGRFDAEMVRQAVRSSDIHHPRSSLIVLENTHNWASGSVWPLEKIAAIHRTADEFNLNMHLDGARLMNACVASGNKPAHCAKYFDTVAICFSKGLGAPVGSAVAGSAEAVKRMHRIRKMLGGGMRQAGIIAAGALYALEHNVDRLAKDHANAKRLAEALADMPGASIDPTTVETNIVFFDVHESVGSAKAFCQQLADQDILMLPLGAQRVRAVTHLDVAVTDIDRAITMIQQILKSKTAA